MEKKLASNNNQNKQKTEWSKKRPIQKLTNNLYLKVAAVVIAIILWASVQASSDGVIHKKFNIPISYTNDQYLNQNDLYLKDYAETITIEVEAKASAIAEMDIAHFTAIADLSARIGDDPYRKLVKVQVTPNATISDKIINLSYKNSELVTITLEPLVTKEFPVEVVTNGELPDGYEMSPDGFNVTPSKVMLRAPESSFSSINKVIVNLSLAQSNGEMIEQKLQPVILDANNKVVSLKDGMTFGVDYVNVTTELLKSKKIAVVIEGTSGTLMEGYQLKGTTLSPDTISVLGTRADLAQIASVIIPKAELNIAGLTESKEFTVDIEKYLPENISLYGDDSVIRVTVSIEALDERSFSIPTNLIKLEGYSDDRNYEFRSSSIMVTLRGLKEDLETLEAEEIELSVDVSSLHLGMNSRIPVIVKVRSGFSVVDSPTTVIMVTERPMSAEPTEEATEESSEISSQDN